MTKKTDLPVRLAMRVEGDWWVAYMASSTSMDDAKRLGSILLGIVESSEMRKRTFMDLMQSAMSDAIRDSIGQKPTWGKPRPAPEAERAGRA